MKADISLRSFREADLPALVRLFHETVHQVARGQYNQAQLDAWAPSSPDLKRWQKKLAEQEVVVAELDGEVVGFCSWDAGGVVDFLYVHHAHQRKGIALKLYSAAESALRSKARSSIHAQVSLTAQPFFAKQGFEVVREQQVSIDGVELPNAVMEKRLNRPKK